MDQVYEILIHKVHDYEGTVNEMTGDGIMALFGAPIALECQGHGVKCKPGQNWIFPLRRIGGSQEEWNVVLQ